MRKKQWGTWTEDVETQRSKNKPQSMPEKCSTIYVNLYARCASYNMAGCGLANAFADFFTDVISKFSEIRVSFSRQIRDTVTWAWSVMFVVCFLHRSPPPPLLLVWRRWRTVVPLEPPLPDPCKTTSFMSRKRKCDKLLKKNTFMSLFRHILCWVASNTRIILIVF